MNIPRRTALGCLLVLALLLAGCSQEDLRTAQRILDQAEHALVVAEATHEQFGRARRASSSSASRRVMGGGALSPPLPAPCCRRPVA